MKKMMVLGVIILTAVSTLTAGAESIWHIWNDAGQFYAYGNNFLAQGAKAEFGVWPVASGHSAGSIWTFDGWNTVRWQDASWCSNEVGAYGNLDEHWVVGMSVSSADTYGNTTPVTIEYAIYVDANGSRYWDNNGGYNYSIVTSGLLSGDPSYLYACP